MHSNLRAKVAYLEGLAEGLDIDHSTKEGRLLTSIIDVLSDMAEAVADTVEAQEELAAYIEDVDSDLSALEDGFYDLDDDDDDDEITLHCPDCDAELEASMEAGDTGPLSD